MMRASSRRLLTTAALNLALLGAGYSGAEDILPATAPAAALESTISTDTTSGPTTGPRPSGFTPQDSPFHSNTSTSTSPTSPTPAISPEEAALNAVRVARVVRPGMVVPGTPTNLNASITLRYGPRKPRTVLILIPGFLGGAGSFDRLARQIVTLDPTVAVWAVDRRSNLLEPQNQVALASDTGLGEVVQKGLPVLPASKVAYMKDWGLDVALRDVRVAVQEAHTLTPNVYLGGHSLGAALSGLYAAYDFDGQAGFRDIRGLVLLDGYPGLLSGNAVTPREYQNGAFNQIGNIPGLKQLADDPYVNMFFYGPSLASKAAAQARLAALHPDDLAPQNFLRWPATNLAAALSTIAQRYTLIPFLAVTAGRAVNARETPSLLPRVLGGKDTQRITGPNDPTHAIGWQTDAQAVTDPHDFVSRFWTPLSDATEWYFPQRLMLDVAAARLDTHDTPYEKDLPVWNNALIRLPILGISAQNGVTHPSDFQSYASAHPKDLTTHTLPGAAHLDMVFAQGNQVAQWITEWVKADEAK